eukprot:1818284-Amphidinium_carterae.2
MAADADCTILLELDASSFRRTVIRGCPSFSKARCSTQLPQPQSNCLQHQSALDPGNVEHLSNTLKMHQQNRPTQM